MGPPREWGNSSVLNSTPVCPSPSIPAQAMLALLWLSQSFQAAFCPWVGRGGGGEEEDRMNIREVEQEKYFKQGKLQGNSLLSSVGSEAPDQKFRGFGWAQIFPTLPRFSSSFPGLISEGLGGGGQDVIHCRRPNTLPKFQRLSLEPWGSGQTESLWLQPQVLPKYLCPAPNGKTPGPKGRWQSSPCLRWGRAACKHAVFTCGEDPPDIFC